MHNALLIVMESVNYYKNLCEHLHNLWFPFHITKYNVTENKYNVKKITSHTYFFYANAMIMKRDPIKTSINPNDASDFDADYISYP